MYDIAKLNKLEREYSALLQQLPGGSLAAYIFEMEGTPMEKINEKISFLEKNIPELKKKLASLGIQLEEDSQS